MKSSIRLLRSRQLPARRGAWSFPALLLIAPLLLPVLSALGDGCFVFKWNKAIDINEPTQKAIIVYDAGREDLLLQVKYEGPLEEFGWLIPVPHLPKVEKGSMEPFYELSKLTQERAARVAAMRSRSSVDGFEQAVKVIEVKTVGAYEVAVLSAKDAGSLDAWLRAHDYTLPPGKGDIFEEYIQKGWYFVAAKIALDKGEAFKLVSSASPKDEAATDRARETLRRQLTSGELHPLLISFDTAQCVFPLRISAVGGKPSEVSLYVLSTEPMLNRLLLDEALQKRIAEQTTGKWNTEEREAARRNAMRNSRLLTLNMQMPALMPLSGQGGRPLADWTLADLEAIASEDEPASLTSLREDDQFIAPYGLPHHLAIKSEEIPRSAKVIPRLKDEDWHLSKAVRTFQPQEMQDLEFQPAVPVFTAMLPGTNGALAVGWLCWHESSALPILLAACQSTNAIERNNAIRGLEWRRDTRIAEVLPRLLRDPEPKIRLGAVRMAANNWYAELEDSLEPLLHDPHAEIRCEAARCLSAHLSRDRSDRRSSLLKASDLDVRAGALFGLSPANSDAVPRGELLRLLGSPRMTMVEKVFTLLHVRIAEGMPAPPIPGWQQPRNEGNRLTSVEAAPLTTNRLTMARLMGLKLLRENADADAITLTLPLLQDTNSLVRNCAFELLTTASGQEFAQTEPAKWEQWWTANRTTFKPAKSNR